MLAVLLILAGALGSALVTYRSGHRVDVLVARHQIKAGQQVTADDLSIARVATDAGAVAVAPASAEKGYEGTYAVGDIPQGTLINSNMFLRGGVVPKNGVIVGVTLQAQQRPAVPLAQNDVVRVYYVPKSAAAAADGTSVDDPSADPVFGQASVLVDSARVAEVQGDRTTSDSGTISLLLSADDARKVVLAVSEGSVAVTRLPSTVKPAVDFLTAAASGAVKKAAK